MTHRIRIVSAPVATRAANDTPPCIPVEAMRHHSNRLHRLARESRTRAYYSEQDGNLRLAARLQGQAEGFEATMTLVDELCARHGVANY